MGRASKNSESCYYKVDLTRSHEHLGFIYKPATHTVDADLLATLQAEEGLVENVRPTE